MDPNSALRRQYALMFLRHHTMPNAITQFGDHGLVGPLIPMNPEIRMQPRHGSSTADVDTVDGGTLYDGEIENPRSR